MKIILATEHLNLDFMNQPPIFGGDVEDVPDDHGWAMGSADNTPLSMTGKYLRPFP